MQLHSGDYGWLMAIGIVIGILSGMLGIGGGVLVIPALVVIFKFTQEQAVGTSLGMLLPPIGIFAFVTYWRAGHVNIPVAATLAGTFAVGALVGSRFITAGFVPEKSLRLMFAFFMLYVAGTMLFRGERRVWAVLQTLTLMGTFGVAYLLLHMIGRRWERTLHFTEEYSRKVEAPLRPDYEI